jgi:hypothetical protein
MMDDGDVDFNLFKIFSFSSSRQDKDKARQEF